MTCKETFDVVFDSLTLLAGVVAFGIGLYQWKRSQDWQRAAKLDDFVKFFQEDDLLRLAATAVDYTRRTTKFSGEAFHLSNTDALLALRDHKTMGTDEGFTPEQAVLRDAYDALLEFFLRLEIAISAGLLDAVAAKWAFGYYLERFVTFDMHPDEKKVLGDRTPADMAAGYVRAYGDVDAIRRLQKHFTTTG